MLINTTAILTIHTHFIYTTGLFQEREVVRMILLTRSNPVFQVSDKDDVAVGRIRLDLSLDDNRGYV